jgi:hypothetical protein
LLSFARVRLLQKFKQRRWRDDARAGMLFDAEKFLVSRDEELGLAGLGEREQVIVVGSEETSNWGRFPMTMRSRTRLRRAPASDRVSWVADLG